MAEVLKPGSLTAEPKLFPLAGHISKFTLPNHIWEGLFPLLSCYDAAYHFDGWRDFFLTWLWSSNWHFSNSKWGWASHMCKGPLCWQRHMRSMENLWSREARRQEDRWKGVRGVHPRAVQAPQGPTDSSLGCSFPCIPPSCLSWSGPFEATPSSSEPPVAPGVLEPTLALPPCPWFSASHFWVHGPIRAQFCPSSIATWSNLKTLFPKLCALST